MKLKIITTCKLILLFKLKHDLNYNYNYKIIKMMLMIIR